MTSAASQDWTVERYRDLLCLHARQLRLDPRLRDKFDEADLVKLTLLRGQQGRADCGAADDVGRAAWLRQVLRNLLHDELRHHHGPQPDGLEQTLRALNESARRFEGWLAAGDDTSGEGLTRLEQLAHLWRALERLPDDQRQAIERKHLGGESIAAIAAALNRSESNVAGLLFRGLGTLRHLLSDASGGSL
jgi:RNA polymerase sigma factor (sigma-70 family)